MTAWIYLVLVDHLLKEKKQKFEETGDLRYIYQNELDIACFQHDMVYVDFRDLAKRAASDKFLRDKAFDIVQNPKLMDINMDVFQQFTFFR